MRTSLEKTVTKYFDVLKDAGDQLYLSADTIRTITELHKINKTWYSHAVKLGILDRIDRGLYKANLSGITRENAEKLLKTMNKKQNKPNKTKKRQAHEISILDQLRDGRGENITCLSASDEELVNELRNRGYEVTAEKHISL